MAQGPFAAAPNSPSLQHAYDLLVGAGRWEPRYSLGMFPLRFPHEEEPDDAGWHIEGSYLPEGVSWYFTNLCSWSRALLLFLFSEVGEEDAPTRIRVGSHLDVPKVLQKYGEDGGERAGSCARSGGGVRPPATRPRHRVPGRRLPVPSLPGERGATAPWGAAPLHGRAPADADRAVRTGAGRRRVLTRGDRDPSGSEAGHSRLGRGRSRPQCRVEMLHPLVDLGGEPMLGQRHVGSPAPAGIGHRASAVPPHAQPASSVGRGIPAGAMVRTNRCWWACL